MVNYKSLAKPKSPLYKIVSDFPGSWDDLRLMKALLLDYYPQDKLLRNLLLTSAEERIPHKLITNQSCNKSEFFRYAKLIVNAHGCSIERAKEIIFLWVDALEIDKRNLIDEYPGHDKCNKLREIRRKIAKANNIQFEPAECTHEGPCRGTCPVCDAEIQYLDKELQKKKDRGEEITIAGIAKDDIRRAQIDIPRDNEFPDMGMAVAGGIDKEFVEGGFDEFELNDSDDLGLW